MNQFRDQKEGGVSAPSSGSGLALSPTFSQEPVMSEPKTAEVKVEDVLFFKLRDLIEEQSEGEWDDATIRRDADKFATALRPMLSASPPAETGEGGPVSTVAETVRFILSAQKPGADDLYQVSGFTLRAIQSALSAQPVSPSEGEAVEVWYDMADPEVTDQNPDNILSGNYPPRHVVEVVNGSAVMFGFWIEPADGSDFQYRYFSDRAQAVAAAHPASDQSDTERMRAALEQIAEQPLGHETATADGDRWRCPACSYAWPFGGHEKHSSDCARVIAIAALAEKVAGQ